MGAQDKNPINSLRTDLGLGKKLWAELVEAHIGN